MCVTTHFIDNEWNLQKKILVYSWLRAIEKSLENCLAKWGIENVLQ